MKHARLGKLYARRRELSRQLADVDKLIAELERRPRCVAVKRVHHATGGCALGLGGQFHKGASKVTDDWSIVDCLVCHRMRGMRKKPSTAVPWRRPR